MNLMEYANIRKGPKAEGLRTAAIGILQSPLDGVMPVAVRFDPYPRLTGESRYPVRQGHTVLPGYRLSPVRRCEILFKRQRLWGYCFRCYGNCGPGDAYTLPRPRIVRHMDLCRIIWI